jgi:hypothetical protein
MYASSFPRVSLALRHPINDLYKKLDYIEEGLKKAANVYISEAEESKVDGPEEDVKCSETGKKIDGVRYYASYFSEDKNEVVHINLSEEAFSQPTSFDLLPLPYFRFADPIPKGAKMPPPFEMTKLHPDNERSVQHVNF